MSWDRNRVRVFVPALLEHCNKKVILRTIGEGGSLYLLKKKRKQKF